MARNLTQQQLAEQAGLGLPTVQRLELGAAATQLSGFMRVCRVLGLVENLDAFIPRPAASPMAQLKLAGGGETLAGVCGGGAARPRVAGQDREDPSNDFPGKMSLNESSGGDAALGWIVRKAGSTRRHGSACQSLPAHPRSPIMALRPSIVLGVLVPCWMAPLIPALADPSPPNIVFILADDLGITDIGAYATHFNPVKSGDLFYETPHLDRLARDGIPFSQAYANQLCSPTRAAILTGRIASRLGVTTATPNTRTYYNQHLTPPAGFDPHDILEHKDPIKGKRPWLNAVSNTAVDPALPTWPKVLKSHDCAFLGKWHLGGHGAPDRQPAAHGFRELAYHDSGASPYFKWQAQWDRRKPMFDTMPGKYRAGMSGPPGNKDYLTDDLSTRAVRYIESRSKEPRPFVLYYCPFAVHTPFQAPKESVEHFNARKQKGHLGRDNATYAAMVKSLDDSVGEIRAALERSGLAKNTILIFTSDNGGVEYTDPPATDNQPFKGGKACLYEGGVRVPAIVWQPGRFEGGTWCDAVIDCTDYLPTVAQLTGNTAPAGLDGHSIVPLLEKPQGPAPRRTLIWHYPFNVSVQHPDDHEPLPPHSAIRVGDDKLIWNWHGRLELYDIAKDPTESHNLAKEQPELTAKLHQQLKDWLKANVAGRYFPRRDPAVPDEQAGGSFPFADLR